MATCVNKNAIEYRTLKDRSGISDLELAATCNKFIKKYGRFPHLDELRGTNSEPHLKKYLKVNSHNAINLQETLNKLGVSTTVEAMAKINKEYSDLETKILPLNQQAIVEITHRPTNDAKKVIAIEQDDKINSFAILDQSILKMQDLYGIKINAITDEELNSDKWNERIHDVNFVKGFIYNGEIYVNIDRATVDTPIHEMLHLLVGSIRFTDPKLYSKLLGIVPTFKNYSKLASEFQDRTQNDINEELFVSELSKYLTGQKSEISKLNNLYDLTYNVKRVLDTILMGQISTKTISDSRLFNLTLKDIATEVNSIALKNRFYGSKSEIHRQLTNIKRQLLRDGTLQEECD